MFKLGVIKSPEKEIWEKCIFLEIYYSFRVDACVYDFFVDGWKNGMPVYRINYSFFENGDCFDVFYQIEKNIHGVWSLMKSITQDNRMWFINFRCEGQTYPRNLTCGDPFYDQIRSDVLKVFSLSIPKIEKLMEYSKNFNPRNKKFPPELTCLIFSFLRWSQIKKIFFS
jgi:hypothetical protein